MQEPLGLTRIHRSDMFGEDWEVLVGCETMECGCCSKVSKKKFVEVYTTGRLGCNMKGQVCSKAPNNTFAESIEGFRLPLSYRQIHAACHSPGRIQTG
jgi:hypothetical protein